MDQLIRKLQADYPAYRFIVGEGLCWSPANGQILYRLDDSEAAISGVLHELAHAVLGHQDYCSDIDLLQKEVAAWQQAITLASLYKQSIDPNHAQDCLDTYRDWLHKRSTCPICQICGVQQKSTQYTCINCGQAWRVSSSRFCRAYRLRQTKRAKADASARLQ